MIIGEYIHKIDSKKRVSLPSRFRKEIGKKVVVTHGLDHCLFVYPLKEWQKVSLKLSELSMGQSDTRGFNRFILAGAVEAGIDKLGRILIPDYLKEFANLKGDVAVIGVGSRIELWDKKTWGDYKKSIEKDADRLAEKLGDIGVI